MRPLSHSSISLYLDCPLKYKFKYIDKVPEAPRHFFSFGKSMHSALEFLYGVQLALPPTLEEVLASYRKGWIKEGYKDAEQEKQYFAEGERILQEYYSKHVPEFRPPLYVEHRFNLDVDGVPVIGFIDRVDKTPEDRIRILDYKTGKAFDLERVRKDPQLTLYQMACRKTIGLEVEALTLYHLPSNTAFTSPPHAPELEEALKEDIRKVAEGIQKEHFEPDPEENKCRWCDFKAPNPNLGFPGCPAWKDEYLTEEEKTTTSYGKVDVEALVDEYGSVKDRIKELEKELEALRPDIEKYFLDKGLRKMSGKQYRLNFEAKKLVQLSEQEEVYRVLKEHGLLEAFLAPDNAAIKKKLQHGSFPHEVMDALKDYIEWKDSTTLRASAIEREGKDD